MQHKPPHPAVALAPGKARHESRVSAPDPCWNLPPDSYRWNRAIRGAFKKGIAAQQRGQPRTDCPYGDRRKPDGRLSWSRSFIAAWEDGWRWSASGKAGRTNDLQRTNREDA